MAVPVGVAVSTTAPPDGKLAEQVPLVTPAVTVQVIPSGALEITPLPVPAPLTVSVPGGNGMRYVASIVRCPFIVMLHGLPVHPVPHAWKIAPANGSCESETTVPTAKLALHAPVPAAGPLSVQSIPAGVLTIRPLPSDAALAITERKFGTKVAVTVRGDSIAV